MRTFAESIYANAAIRATVLLPKAGTCLENPYVFDASARDIKILALDVGLVGIVNEQRDAQNQSDLITNLSFVKIG